MMKMKRPTGKQMREFHRMQREQQMRQFPKQPETEKEILDKIHELEYQRIKIPKVLNNPKYPMAIIGLTEQIKLLYMKLEMIKGEKKDESN